MGILKFKMGINIKGAPPDAAQQNYEEHGAFRHGFSHLVSQDLKLCQKSFNFCKKLEVWGLLLWV